eukprot:10150774-Alexandrium_andersonii.AAC.1
MRAHARTARECLRRTCIWLPRPLPSLHTPQCVYWLPFHMSRCAWLRVPSSDLALGVQELHPWQRWFAECSAPLLGHARRRGTRLAR